MRTGKKFLIFEAVLSVILLLSGIVAVVSAKSDLADLKKYNQALISVSGDIERFERYNDAREFLTGLQASPKMPELPVTIPDPDEIIDSVSEPDENGAWKSFRRTCKWNAIAVKSAIEALSSVTRDISGRKSGWIADEVLLTMSGDGSRCRLEFTLMTVRDVSAEATGR